MNNNILQENNKLHEKIKYLKHELDSVYDVIDKHLANEIIQHINKTNSIKLTANYYKIDPDWIYCKIPEWDDCNDRLYHLSDYKEYLYKVEGRQVELDDCEFYDTNKIDKLRTPDHDELECIFYDYLCTNMRLYDIADKYNIIILNLFRLLKEERHIENEKDARGYHYFLKEYYGNYYNENVNKDLNLIEQFYKKNKNKK
jgi:hypothetical protein